MIPLYGLEIAKDDNSPYKLVFNLTEKKELIHSPILNKDSGYFSSEDVDENGLPKKLVKGNRGFYTRKTGLSELYSDDDLYLFSDGEHLEDSNACGRVVVVNLERVAKI